MSRSVRHRLLDILETAEHALAALRGKCPADIESDWLLRHAIQGAIVIIAEATSALPATLTSRYAHIPWSDIVGMGVKIKHHYHRVEPRLLWDTVTGDLPVLIDVVRAMLASEDEHVIP